MHSILCVTVLLCLGAAHASKLYVGCYADSSEVRAVSDCTLLILNGTDNHVTCANYCRQRRYEFAAVQGGDECRCGNGNSFTRYGRRADSQCEASPCPDGSDTCGGTFSNAVYSTENYYVACVQDDPNARILSTKLYASSSNTPERCIRECTEQGIYSWAGLQNGRACWCGYHFDYNNIPGNTLAQSQCDKECSGSPHETCGAYRVSDVYHLYA